MKDPKKIVISPKGQREISNLIKNVKIKSEPRNHIKKAKHDVASFCRDPNAARWIHPDISQLERHALFSLLCQEASKTQSALNIGDVVLQDDKLLQMTDTGLQPYLPSLHDGDVVYRLNPPLSLLLYDNGQLKIANNGDTVIKDNQAFVVENNQLVKR